MNDPLLPAPSPLACAMRGLCPRCAGAGLFEGTLRFASRCKVCGLDFTSFNVGDGAAAFLILIIGAIVSVLAIVVELRWSPPWWLHLILWPPLAFIFTIASMRVIKGLLLVLEYRNDAREGRISKGD